MNEEIPHELAQNTCYVRCHPSRKFFHGRVIRGSGDKDLAWFRPDGKQMTDQDWGNRLPSGEELFKKTGHDMDEELAVLMRKCSDRGRQDYNTIRPHSVLNYRPPAPEAILPPT